MLRKLARHTLASLLTLSLISCGGGGGGGGSFVGAAEVALTVTPRTLDTGDRALVSVSIADVSEDGIALKLRYPDGLSYVPDSAFLTVDGEKRNVSPTVNTVVDEQTYLVIYLKDSWFGENIQGDLTLEIEGLQSVKGKKVEVDADVDDPAVGNNTEFDPQNPEFTAQDSQSIEVQG